MRSKREPKTLPTGQSVQTVTVLMVLRISLHVMFAFLVLFGTVATLLSAAPAAKHTAVAVLSLALGGIYLWGTIFENRLGLPSNLHQVFSRAKASAPYRPEQTGTPLPVALWLGCITLLWLVLMLLSSSFTWVVFPIMFLYLHLLRPVRSVLATLLLCCLAVALPLVGPAGFGLSTVLHDGVAPGYLIGPTLGALLAIVISFTYRALREDAAHQYRLAERLRAVQAQLVQQQYSAGKVEERERLAREIHDTLAQGLSSIVLVSRAAERSLQEGDRARASEQLSIISASASENLAEARRFIKDLSSPALDDSLISALQRLATTTAESRRALGKSQPGAEHFVCTFTFEGNEDAARQLPSQVAAAVMRCAQGALANVVAHSQATRSALTLTLWPEKVILDVLDNGRGFDPGAAESRTPSTEGHTGFGLTAMHNRVQALGGSLELESGTGGTALTVSFPLHLQEKA